MPSKTKKITTSVLPGFMELLPAEQILFNKMLSVIRQTYESFGFIPLDTPAIERSEVLLAKAGGETEKQIYRFSKGDNDLSLRFDLTVPLARYVSEHFSDLTFPFRRYHIAKVYRGERPQKGRYREFYQCDIDIIGNGTLSLVNDAEILTIIYDVFKGLGLPSFKIRISNRKLINGLLKSLDLKGQAGEVMRIIDKIEKVSPKETRQSLRDIGLDKDKVEKIWKFVGIKGDVKKVLKDLEGMGQKDELFKTGLKELTEVISYIELLGLPASAYGLDLSIARGLDYYTGTVYETILEDYKEMGSVCSGGRYDNLAENYTSQKLPGVGISIGLTRLFSRLKEAGLIQAGEASPARVLVIPFNQEVTSSALSLGRKLRASGLVTEVYLEEAKFKNKLSYANKLGIRHVVLVGEDEIASSLWTLKDMETGKQQQLATKELITELKRA